MAASKDPKPPFSLTKSIFVLMGATVGSLEGISKLAAKDVISHLHRYHHTATQKIEQTSQKLKKTLPSPDKALEQLYYTSGALAGLYKGAGYALVSLWWYLTEDEIKAKLLKGSPIKYQLQAEDFINRPSKATIMAMNTSNGIFVVDTITKNDEQQQEEEEDMGHAVNNAYGLSDKDHSPYISSTPPMATPPPTASRNINLTSVELTTARRIDPRCATVGWDDAAHAVEELDHHNSPRVLT